MQDLKFAFRQLLKNPGFTAVAVLTLALGIGVNTSMFTALQSLLMRDLPYPDSGRLVQVFRTSPHSQRWPHSPANFLDYQSRNEVFERMAAVNSRPFNLAEAGKPAERVRGLQVSADLFPLLGIQAALGRGFTADEDQPGRNQVVVLDHGFWVRRFAGDTNILGRTLRLDGESVTVVGVMPARFRDPMSFGPVDVWRPIAFTEADRQNRGGNYLRSFARLKPGVSLAQAQAGMDILVVALRKDLPDLNPGEGLRLVSLARSMDPKGHLILWFSMMLAGFVLLIACANLANLQFARTAMRTREFAIRGALGAPRGRLLRQLLTESLLLSVFGGLLGVLLANWGNEVLSRQIVVDDEAVLSLPLNLKVLGFAFAASAVAGLVFGLFPAWLASRTAVGEALKQGGRGATDDRSRHRLQHALVVAEVALSLVLLAGAGLVVNGLRGFAALDPGWRVAGLTVGYLSLPDNKYGGGDSLRVFIERLREELAAIPGVERSTVAWSLPVSSFGIAGDFTIEGREPAPRGREPLRFLNGVTPGYFETMGMRMVAGRDFTAADTTNRPLVVIINETMARTFWPNESPLGKRIGTEEIVGVVGDVRFPADPSEPLTRYQTYRPLIQEPRNYLAIALRGSVSVESLRRAITKLDADLPVNNPGLAQAAVGRILSNIAVGGRLFTAFAALGLSLATLGIYGVIAGFVVRRTHEIGVRIALGAQLREVLWLVIGKGLRLALLGAAIGLVGAFGIARLLASAVPELRSNHPLTIVFVAAVLVVVALFACWLPARRAARVDPMVALRNE